MDKRQAYISWVQEVEAIVSASRPTYPTGRLMNTVEIGVTAWENDVSVPDMAQWVLELATITDSGL